VLGRQKLKTLLSVTAGVTLVSFHAYGDLLQLNWMTGCWAPAGADPGSVEQWSSPAGGTMFGFNRTVRQGKTVAFEYLRIVDEGDNVIVLIASPSGQETAQFRMREQTEREIVFENPLHDFPQRISYRLDDGGNLLGRIEGKIDGAERIVNFPMLKISCDGDDNAASQSSIF
jgi:hypothetical protein